jgi:hypothetical protein
MSASGIQREVTIPNEGKARGRINIIIRKNTEIDSKERVIKGSRTYNPTTPEQKNIPINIYEIKEDISGRRWLDKKNYKPILEFSIPVTKIEGIDNCDRKFEVELTLFQGGILDVNVCDIQNDSIINNVIRL